LEKDS
jgi:hypothetical protein